ncbi:MAG TPA: hypothetical protein VIT68_03870 [Candidatus Gracilibacteria bacterium]
MSEGGNEGLDGLLMGNVAEDVTENDEQIAARIAAAQAKIAKIRKQENKAKNYDHILAKLVPILGKVELDFVIFCIDHEVPSLTILSVLSILRAEAEKACHEEFHKYIEEKADFSMAQFKNRKVEDKVATWWTFIVGADMMSDTIRLKQAYGKEEFAQKFPRFMAFFLHKYLKTNHQDQYDEGALIKILKGYAERLFEVEEALELELVSDAAQLEIEKRKVEREEE